MFVVVGHKGNFIDESSSSYEGVNKVKIGLGFDLTGFLGYFLS